MFVPAQDLVDSYLPSFQVCVEEGKASGIMCSVSAAGRALKALPHLRSASSEAHANPLPLPPPPPFSLPAPLHPTGSTIK